MNTIGSFLAFFVSWSSVFNLAVTANVRENAFSEIKAGDGSSVCANSTMSSVIAAGFVESFVKCAVISLEMCQGCAAFNYKADENLCEFVPYESTDFAATPGCRHFAVEENNLYTTSGLACSDLMAYNGPILVQQANGSGGFNHTWAEFKAGFRADADNFWLGNDCLHTLTTSRTCQIRFDTLGAADNIWYYAVYSTFIVANESSNYTVSSSGFSGTANDNMPYHDGHPFITLDRKDDLCYLCNCAVNDLGGFWNVGCSAMSINTPTVGTTGWDTFQWYGLPGGGAAGPIKLSRVSLLCT